MTDDNTNSPIGLALSGGVTFGAAHVGVIRALEEQNIHIGWVAGTSVGAVIGALYAFDVPVGEIESIVRHSSWLDVGQFAPSRLGLLSNSRLGKTLTGKLGDVNLEDAPRPFTVIAVDIRTGEKLTLRQGNLARAVMASTCIPGIFAPVQWGNRLLVDGGIIENLPIDAVRQLGAERVVGVALRARFPYPQPKTVIDIVINASRILVYNTARAESNQTQVIIVPKLTAYSSMDTNHIPELIEEGYRAAQNAINDIRGLVARPLSPDLPGR
jgi:NTE family protein